jgi:hypothetical protein
MADEGATTFDEDGNWEGRRIRDEGVLRIIVELIRGE